MYVFCPVLYVFYAFLYKSFHPFGYLSGALECAIVPKLGFVRKVRAKSDLYIFIRKNVCAFGTYFVDKIECLDKNTYCLTPFKQTKSVTQKCKREKTHQNAHFVHTLRASPGYNCEAAHEACRKRRLLGTQQWQSALLVVGLPVCNLHP